MLRERLSAWRREAVTSLKKKWWLWLLGLIYLLIEDRAISTLNAWIDRQTGWVYSMLKGYVSPLLAHSDTIAITVFIGVMLVLFVHAYFDTRKPKLVPAGTNVQSSEERAVAHAEIRASEREVPRPNIECCGADLYNVRVESHQIEKDLNSKHAAVVVSFKNTPLEIVKIADAHFVQAEILFKMSDGNIYTRVHHGLWLGEIYNATSFSVNAKRDLVVMLSKESRTDLITVHDEREAGPGPYTELHFENILPGNKQYRVEIALVVDGMRMPSVNFELVLDPQYRFKRISQ